MRPSLKFLEEYNPRQTAAQQSAFASFARLLRARLETHIQANPMIG
jgi:hypothetical protein